MIHWHCIDSLLWVLICRQWRRNCDHLSNVSQEKRKHFCDFELERATFSILHSTRSQKYKLFCYMQDLLQFDYNSIMNGKWSSLLKFVRLVLHEFGYRLVKRIVSEHERRQAAPLTGDLRPVTGRTQGANVLHNPIDVGKLNAMCTASRCQSLARWWATVTFSSQKADFWTSFQWKITDPESSGRLLQVWRLVLRHSLCIMQSQNI